MPVWRLRGAKEREQIFEELSALLPREILEAMQYVATAKKHSFRYVNLLNEWGRYSTRASSSAWCRP
eukprot:14721579-Alexandrium_andersonii.AAC.1